MTLTPLRESALRAMLCGPLRLGPDGWRSTAGIDGCWNSITIGYLGERGLLQQYWDDGIKHAKIRRAGRDLLSQTEGWAA